MGPGPSRLAETSSETAPLRAPASDSRAGQLKLVRAGAARLLPTRLLRRSVELVIATGLLLALLPLMVLIALVIKLTSRGPVMFCQERVGQGGSVFTMYKYRTMRVGAEDESGPVWSKKNDPRCTWAGGFLRRWSLDELPQLFNVLRGDMSLVGPRPERPFFVDRFSQELPEYPLRHLVQPGITGWAQVNGWRGDTGLKNRLECDLYYVRHRTVWLELYILLLTPLSVLSTKNAH